MRRILLAVLLALAALIVALSFHQPPMRLMPTPAVLLSGLPAAFAPDPDAPADNRLTLFYATNRLAVGPRNDRLYAVVPGRDLQFGVATIRIGGEDTGWDTIYALSTQAGRDGRPKLHLDNMTELGAVEEDAPPGPGTRAWLALVDAAIARSRDRDVIVYVHGANSTVERAMGQAAQLRHFTGRNSVVVLFAWPTAENFLRYPRDIATAYGAAPQLARLVRLLARHTRAGKIDVLSYSAGGTVASDGLALAAADGRADSRLGEVYFAAPDVDTRGFARALPGIAGAAGRVTVAANMNDLALRLSQAINRASRAGRPDLAELSPEETRWLLAEAATPRLDLVRVRPEDIPGLSARSHAFWYDDPWVSSDVLLTLLFDLPPAARGLDAARSPQGAPYWVFPRDYPARLPGVVARVRSDEAAAPSGRP